MVCMYNDRTTSCFTDIGLTYSQGLLNKRMQIGSIIGQNRSPDHLKRYKFYIGEQIINCTTWAPVQRSATQEVLDIDLIADEYIPQIQVIKSDHSFHDPAGGASVSGAPTPRDTNFAVLEPAPIVLPFLAWPIEDELEGYPQPLVADRLLHAIYSSLAATCPECRPHGPHSLNQEGVPRGSRLRDRAEMSIKGKTASEVADACGGRAPQISFYLQMRRLLSHFVPEGHAEECPPIRLYWGASHELLVVTS